MPSNRNNEDSFTGGVEGSVSQCCEPQRTTMLRWNVMILAHILLCCTRPTYREIVIASNRPRGLLRCGHPPSLPVCCVHSPPLPTKRGPFCPIYCRPFGRLAGRLASLRLLLPPPLATHHPHRQSRLSPRAPRTSTRRGSAHLLYDSVKGLPGQ